MTTYGAVCVCGRCVNFEHYGDPSGEERPGDILGTDHERQPSTNQLEEFDPCFGDERFGVNQKPPVKQRKYEELCGRKRRPFFFFGCYSSFQQGRRSLVASVEGSRGL